MVVKPTGARYQRVIKSPEEGMTVKELREGRFITAKQALAAHNGHDARLTDIKELWVTLGRTRVLIDRSGVIVQSYKK